MEGIEFHDPGSLPVLDWIDKGLITVDPLYQRPLDTARVQTILKAFAWRSFGALVLVPQVDGTFHATDGQHRLEAAKLHPKITAVPGIIVQAKGVASEASIFVDINKNRKNVSPLELFFAGLAAGDKDAADTLKAAQRAGIRIPKYPGTYKPRDCVSVAAIQSLVREYAPDRVNDFLEVAAAADFAPISAAQLRAVQHLLTDREYSDQITKEDLAATVKTAGTTLDNEAKRFAATHGCPFWKGLASVWFQKCKKRRAPAKPASVTSLVASTSEEAPIKPRLLDKFVAPVQPVVPHKSITAAVFGDPPPGRSALENRSGAADKVSLAGRASV